MDGPQGKFVYVVGKDKDGKDVADAAPGRRRRLGRRRQRRTSGSIESGLKPGDQVIVNGIAKVMPGAPVKVGGAHRRPARPAAAAAVTPRRPRRRREPADAAAMTARRPRPTATAEAAPAKSASPPKQ